MLREEILDSTTLKVMDFLLDNPVMDYSKKEIAEHAGISRSTLYRKWDTLEELGIVKKTRKFQSTQLYKLNTDSNLVNKIGELIDNIGAIASKRECGEDREKVTA